MRTIIIMVALFGLSACQTARVVGNPMRTVQIREQCRNEAQLAHLPAARETAQVRAHRISQAHAAFQTCLKENF
ncbi:MAG: hypothetical protein V3S71_02705 [Acidobacteriota bacterium]